MADSTRTFFFGDSLTLGVGDALALGWVGRVMRQLPVDPATQLPPTFYNLGVRGDTSAGIAHRWHGELVARCPEGVRPRLVFAFGVNDARTLYPEGPSLLLADETLRYARTIFGQASALGPVVLVGPPAVADETSNERIATRSEQLHALCRELGVPFVDVHPETNAHADYLDALRAGDGYHPGAAGYDLLADLVATSEAWRATFGAG